MGEMNAIEATINTGGVNGLSPCLDEIIALPLGEFGAESVDTTT
jgi:hypothetical protein